MRTYSRAHIDAHKSVNEWYSCDIRRCNAPQVTATCDNIRERRASHFDKENAASSSDGSEHNDRVATSSATKDDGEDSEAIEGET